MRELRRKAAQKKKKGGGNYALLMPESGRPILTVIT